MASSRVLYVFGRDDCPKCEAVLNNAEQAGMRSKYYDAGVLITGTSDIPRMILVEARAQLDIHNGELPVCVEAEE